MNPGSNPRSPAAFRGKHPCPPLDLERRSRLRRGDRADQGLRRGRGPHDPLPRAARQGRREDRAPARRPATARRSRASASSRATRSRSGEYVVALQRRDQGRRPAQAQGDRARGVRPRRPDRPGLLRQAVQPRPAEGRRGRLRAAGTPRSRRRTASGSAASSLRPREQLVARAARRRRRCACRSCASPTSSSPARTSTSTKPKKAPAKKEVEMAGALVDTLADRLRARASTRTRTASACSRSSSARRRARRSSCPSPRSEETSDDLHRPRSRLAEGDEEGKADAPRRCGAARCRSAWSTCRSRCTRAVRDIDVHFNQLDEETGARLRVQRVCKKEDDEVPYEEIAHGYPKSRRARLRDAHRRRARGRRAGEDAHDRHHRVRPARRHRPDLLRPPVLPRARSARARARCAPTSCSSR